MPITSVHKDSEALTMTVAADFAAPLQRLWDAYADPRQLEKFWGPPAYPATFTRHDMFPGGRSAYAMVARRGTSRAATGSSSMSRRPIPSRSAMASATRTGRRTPRCLHCG